MAGGAPQRLRSPRSHWMRRDWLSLRALAPALQTAMTQALAGRDPAGLLVLDLGCGERPWAGLFGTARVIGVDRSAEGASPDLVADAAALPLPDGCIDIVFSSQVLEHVPDPQAMLQACARVLKPGGALVLSAPFWWPLHEEPRDHWRFTRHGLGLLLRRAGLVPASITPDSGAVTQAAVALIEALPRWARPLVPLINLSTPVLQAMSTNRLSSLNLVLVAHRPQAHRPVAHQRPASQQVETADAPPAWPPPAPVPPAAQPAPRAGAADGYQLARLQAEQAAGSAPGGRRHILALLEALARRHAIQGLRVLELGSGLGANLRVLAAGNQVQGVEALADAAALATGAGVPTLCADLERGPLPWPAASWDWVLLLDVLEHLVHPDAVLAEAQRLLAPGGRLVVNVPNPFHWRSRWRLLAGAGIDSAGHFPGTPAWRQPHLRHFRRADLLALLQHTGWQVIDEWTEHQSALPKARHWPRLARACTRRWPEWLASGFFVVAARAGTA